MTESDALVHKSYNIIVPQDEGYVIAYTVNQTDNLLLNVREVNHPNYLPPEVKNYTSTQGGNSSWPYNERIKSITQLRDGQWFVCREKSVQKLYGSKQWDKVVTKSDSVDLKYGCTVNDGFVTVGIKNYGSKGNINISDSVDIYVCKLDSNGVKVWEKTIGGNLKESVEKVVGMDNGDMIILGGTRSPQIMSQNNHGKTDVLLQRIDKYGKVLWTKVLGGSEEDWGVDIMKDNKDGCIVLASTSSHDGDISFNKGKTDIWLLNINKAGEIMWEKTYGSSGEDGASKMMKNSKGDLVLFAYAENKDGDYNIPEDKTGYWIVTLALPVGIQEEEAGGVFLVKPNPAQDDIVISGLNQKTERITITTLLGESVVEFPTNRMPTVSVPTNNLSNGVYVIRVGNYAEKLIIQR